MLCEENMRTRDANRELSCDNCGVDVGLYLLLHHDYEHSQAWQQ